ncbi:MAG: glutathione S-transferase [Pseudomonadota bacterium]
MKLYEYEAFPHPRRVRMFLAEKGLDVPRVQVDVPAGEHRQPAFLAKNPDGAVPVLELDGGECITETTAISRYFEEVQPKRPLFGESPESKAAIEMWQRRVEQSLMAAVGSYFHHATEGLGDAGRYRNRDWGEKNRETALEGMRSLNEQLAGNTYVAGADFSVADITALCALDFAKALGIVIPEGCDSLRRWYEEVSARPSASA